MGVLVLAMALGMNVAAAAGRNASASTSSAAHSPAEQEIRATLDRWRNSFLDLNLQQNVNCYASSLTRYFTAERVPLARVQFDKKKAFAQIKRVRQYDISDMQLRVESPDQAYVTFHKTWDFDLVHGDTSGGEEIEALRLAKFGSEWKITSEQEVRVIRRTTGPRDSEVAQAKKPAVVKEEPKKVAPPPEAKIEEQPKPESTSPAPDASPATASTSPAPEASTNPPIPSVSPAPVAESAPRSTESFLGGHLP
ncbi:MAG: hypothetical protein H0X25_03095, partial [Acidobacteriales bacterium]|nr:hypothetical protein [Terriglobales bacterium]